MATILILGSSGMLGSMVDLFFRHNTKHTILSTYRGLDDPKSSRFSLDVTDGLTKLRSMMTDFGQIDYVLNCIGVIKPYCKDNDPAGVLRAIKINALFPHELMHLCEDRGARLIQIATDCVYSGKSGGYVEDSPHDALDVYGKTKSLGEVDGDGALNLRCSIIGPELKGRLSLLEWVLSQTDGATVKGFTHHRWNGVTTLQFAQMCNKIIEADVLDHLARTSRRYHCIVNQTVTKWELVKSIAAAYGKKLEVEPVDSIGEPVDRTLQSKYEWIFQRPSTTIQDALSAMKQFAHEAGYGRA